jgi:hypothetical protein
MTSQPKNIAVAARVEHVDYPGDGGIVTGPAGPIGGHPAMNVRWDDGSETATWTHKLVLADEA